MSSTSIATGTPQDDNENHPAPQDHWPSRTLGADAQPASGSRPAAPSSASIPRMPVEYDASGDPPLGDADVPSEVEDAATLPAVHVDLAQLDRAFPEGPNVAPSPWEEEAARGRS